jgi:hypothetical protein
MTSQLNVDTIVDKAGSGGTNVKIGNTSTYVSEGGAVTQNIVQGLAKAFICIDVSEAAAFSSDDSFNIASVTDNGTGNFGITFTNSMKTSRYSAPAGGYSASGHAIGTQEESTSGTSIKIADNGGSASDLDCYTTITGTMA